MQLIPGVVDTVAIVGIDDEDEALRVLVVMTPEGADLVLAPDVPDREGNILVVYLSEGGASRGTTVDARRAGRTKLRTRQQDAPSPH